MRLSFKNRTVIDPDGCAHYNPRVTRYSVNLRREHFLPLMLISILILGAGGYFVWSANQFAKIAGRTSGTVIRVERTTSTNNPERRSGCGRLLQALRTQPGPAHFQHGDGERDGGGGTICIPGGLDLHGVSHYIFSPIYLS